eukprot:CAMPEP_0115423406 /NCGR_PEP_ID=MMETSP0271-20121206/27292_1 /TAXON_ID=71861 /ORGANISM="Scrippsiella trochoidea, Strain CCMP3099" /LENGTH=242 /DNA_ID=CAMNT_0002848161 /DNA_START=341 /DNA_END=1071 /DNA_ORIENTATION=-
MALRQVTNSKDCLKRRVVPHTPATTGNSRNACRTAHERFALQRHDEEDCIFDVHDKRGPAINCRTAQSEAIGERLGIHRVRHVNHQVQLPGRQHGKDVWLPLHMWLVNSDAGVHIALCFEELCCALCGVELEAHIHEDLHVLQDLQLLLEGPIEKRMFFDGSLKPAEIIAFKKASYWFWPKQATSPVDCISTPKRGSEFFRRLNEKTGTLAATQSMSIGWIVTAGCGRPNMMRVAIAMKFTL